MMNLWKHDDQTRYDDTIYGGSERLLVRFEEAPEASLRHLEKKLLKPLLEALTKSYKKKNVKRIDVTLTCRSTMTLFDFASFLPTSAAMRLFLQNNFANVHDWQVVALDNQSSGSLEFEIKLYGADLCA